MDEPKLPAWFRVQGLADLDQVAGYIGELQARAIKAEAERDRLRVERDLLRVALQSLIDEQNGPPLIRDAPAWYRAMVDANRALGRYESVEYYEQQIRS